MKIDKIEDTLQFTKSLISTYDLGSALSLNFNAPPSRVNANLSMIYTQSIDSSDQNLECTFTPDQPVTCTFSTVSISYTPMQFNYTLFANSTLESKNVYSSFVVQPNIYQGLLN